MRHQALTLGWVAAVGVALVAWQVSANEKGAASAAKKAAGGYAAVFAIDDPTAPAEKLLFVYREATMQLALYRVDRGALRQIATAPAEGRVWAATTFRHEGTTAIAVAYGLSRKAIDAPVRVILYDLGLTTPRTIFERGSSRSQTTDLRQIGDALFVKYFDSKYHTQAGTLQPTKTGHFSFNALFRTRLGMALDWDGPSSSWVIGRPYADDALKQPELLLHKDDQWLPLPSRRGVSSVAFFRSAKDKLPQILVGDGWHQHYAKEAQAHLSLLTYQPKKKRYSHTVIDTASPQIRISKIVPVVSGARTVILAGGETLIDAHYPGKRWRKRRIHQTRSKDPLTSLDFAVLRRMRNEILLAIYDGELLLLSVPLSR